MARLLGCLLGLGAVALGAVIAHPGEALDEAARRSLELAQLFHFAHALAVLALGVWQLHAAGWARRLAGAAALSLTAGVLLFCGGIYLRHLADTALPPIAMPLGGVLLMAGWLLAAAAALAPASGARSRG